MMPITLRTSPFSTDTLNEIAIIYNTDVPTQTLRDLNVWNTHLYAYLKDDCLNLCFLVLCFHQKKLFGAEVPPVGNTGVCWGAALCQLSTELSLPSPAWGSFGNSAAPEEAKPWVMAAGLIKVGL